MFDYYINVPMNDKGQEEFDNYEVEMPDVHTEELTEAEYRALDAPKTGLFHTFQKKFGIIIDECEEEILPNRYAVDAGKIVRAYLRKSVDPAEKSGLEKVLHSLEYAIISGKDVEFDIYLHWD